ncbi:interferon-induced GTP-binding protein Mx-like isoform X2 [Carcharodon carcharias]|uniref:interferon-induced GTP-binding protein Mx-like isoform X2 n=1 Tax=Carcharodon carcharias TaxID=13397 RepID=UPI001B7F5331|nr:interferon-induced GTP-binding protein Mx-like isoform X2 [Carcharodon carcharias]
MAVFCDKYEEKVRTYINVIDEMRSMGIDKEFSLPTIAVIGDQSSGKSSVLEMLSDVGLPRGTGVVTRCPLELKLKKIEENKPWKAQISYRDYSRTLNHASQVEDEILKAQDILTESISISSELISLQVESSNTPDLTLIDLPGITRVAIGNQPQDIGKLTKGLIRSYIQRKETIILVVIPCTMDIATTEALKMAHEFDPDGERTLGVLTKPDLIDKGTEESILNIIENKVVPLKKGYILVKCRGQNELNANTTMSAALEEEITFLKNSSHFRPLLEKGVASFEHLSEKLTNELIQQIANWLPIMEEALREKVVEIQNKLDELGTNIPGDAQARKLFLNCKILTYCEELTSLVMGDYKKDYDNEKKICDYSRRVFSGWYNKLEIEKVRLNDEAMSKVRFHDKYSQGRELPGFTKYRVFESVIREQIQKLLPPSLQLMKELADKVQQVFNAMGFEHFQNFPNLILATKIAIDRLVQMVPMVTRYHLLQEFANQVKLEMAQTFLNESGADGLLDEHADIKRKRERLTDSLNQLNKARSLLMAKEISRVQ